VLLLDRAAGLRLGVPPPVRDRERDAFQVVEVVASPSFGGPALTSSWTAADAAEKVELVAEHPAGVLGPMPENRVQGEPRVPGPSQTTLVGAAKPGLQLVHAGAVPRPWQDRQRGSHSYGSADGRQVMWTGTHRFMVAGPVAARQSTDGPPRSGALRSG
jgi:hypothetical protein